MIKNRKVHHIGLYTRDAIATADWYIKVLGFELIGDYDAPNIGKAKFVRSKDTLYKIVQWDCLDNESISSQISHIAYQSDDIERDYKYCIEQGYQIISDGIEEMPTFWDHGCRSFKIKSITGEKIEFCEVIKQSHLFCLLPDYVSTPDGMAIHENGDLVLSCPNFADPTMKGCILRITKDRHISKWFDVPILEETGQARPMGIEFGPDGDLYIVDNQGWFGDRPEFSCKGRILRVRMDGDKMIYCKTIAYNMEHPNGIRIWKDKVYVTTSKQELIEDPSGKLVSCVNVFGVEEENIRMTNTMEDAEHILCTFVTENLEDQYGVDGIAFDKEGDLYIGNFGDGAVWRIRLNEKGTMESRELFAKDPDNLQVTDGMVFDDDGNLYIADFSSNAIAKVYPDGIVERIAQSPDSDGFNGELDQPGEPCYWNGNLIISCFDLVTGSGKVNTKHEMPATMAMIRLKK